MRDRLIELRRQAMKHARNANCDIEREMMFADYLLDNGVIVPPCKVGDTVYRIFNEKVVELRVIAIPMHLSTSGCFSSVTAQNNRGASISIDYNDFGKTTFLTREEAERALEGGVQE